MRELILSKRYARALLNVAKKEGRIAETAKDLRDFTELCAEKRAFFHWLTCEEVAGKKREAALCDVANVMGFSKALRNFLSVLIASERIGFLPHISKLFSEMADEETGIVRGILFTADAAGADDAAKGIAGQIQDRTKKDVRIEARIRPQVIAGAVLKIKNVLWDASVKRKLQEMEKIL